MYPRNAVSPEPIAIGPVVQISDGAVQTAGVTVRVKPIGVAEADGGGTTAYSTDGVVLYTPTQAETNYTSFVLIAKKTGCIPASVTVVTSASNTTGYAGTDQSKILNPSSTVNLSGTSISTSQTVASVTGSVTVGGYATGQAPLQPTTAGRTLDVSAGGEAGIDLANIGSPTTTVNLSGLTIKTATDIETDTQDIQARLPAALVDGRMVAQAQSVTDKSGYTLTQAFPANFSLLGIGATGEILLVQTLNELAENALTANGAIDAIPPAVWNASTTVTYVDGSFGDRVLISTNNTRSVSVTGSGHVASVLHDAEPNSIPEDAFVTGAVSARVLADGAIDSGSIAAGALNGKGDWLTSLGANAPVNWINAAAITTDAITGDKIAASAVTKISTGVSNLEVLTRLASMIESDGAGQFRFDTIAVSMAVGGGGGAVNITVEDRSITVT